MERLFRILSKILILLFSMLLFSCASSIKTTVMRAAEITLPGNKVIAIGNVAANTMAKSDSFANALINKLKNTNYFDSVLDRQNINTLQQERDYLLKFFNNGDGNDYFSTESPVFASNMIFATVEECYTENNSQTERKDKNGYIHTDFKRTGNIKVTVYFKIINVESMETIATKSISENRSETTSATDKKPTKPNMNYAYNNCIDKILTEFTNYITPHPVTVSVRLMSDKQLPDSDSIANMMQSGDTQTALETLKEATQATYENDPENKILAKAYYNYGVALAVVGKYDEGIDYIRSAKQTYPKESKFQDGLTFALREKRNAERVAEQMNYNIN